MKIENTENSRITEFENEPKVNCGNQKTEDFVPISQKFLLTIDEAAKYTNIGQNKLRSITDDPSCPFVLFIGRRKLVKRRKFEQYLDKVIEI